MACDLNFLTLRSNIKSLVQHIDISICLFSQFIGNIRCIGFNNKRSTELTTIFVKLGLGAEIQGRGVNGFCRSPPSGLVFFSPLPGLCAGGAVCACA